MSQRMLIDARHPEETRVAVVNGTRIEEFDFEAAERKQLKGNIYLAKVTRVEPSLQAAFIDYGGNRHGFLAFSEIHPDYYQIPREDREALLREEAELAAEEHHDDHETGEDGEEIAVVGGGDDAGSDVLRRQRQALRRKYKIQEVIRRRQVILVQVVKEERGNKGAAMTTYLSLAGRFCVLMPNTAHGGGINRKISNLSDRKRLKSIMADLQLPAGMGAIVRTAGLKRTKVEIKRDFDYLTRLWDEIRDTTLSSVAPCLVHQDSDLIKRAIRDIYSRDIEQVLVDGDAGFKAASTFMDLLMPTHTAKVVQYTDAVPLFQRFGVETALAGMYQPVVQLKSGGYIVINPTEALVSIDVNSGRSTREHGIEETAYKTNLEAADEIGRQLRLRDMAGLVVIDFIDMDVGGNNRRVEKAMKEAMKNDRARIAIGRISSFGLMEMSRQRLRTGVLEASTHVCPMCDGSGYVRSVGSAALAALRALQTAHNTPSVPVYGQIRSSESPVRQIRRTVAPGACREGWARRRHRSRPPPRRGAAPGADATGRHRVRRLRGTCGPTGCGQSWRAASAGRQGCRARSKHYPIARAPPGRRDGRAPGHRYPRPARGPWRLPGGPGGRCNSRRRRQCRQPTCRGRCRQVP